MPIAARPGKGGLIVNDRDIGNDRTATSLKDQGVREKVSMGPRGIPSRWSLIDINAICCNLLQFSGLCPSPSYFFFFVYSTSFLRKLTLLDERKIEPFFK